MELLRPEEEGCGKESLSEQGIVALGMLLSGGLQLGQSYRMRGFGQGGRAQPGSVPDSGHGALHEHFAPDPPAAGVVLVGFSIAG